MRWQYTDFEKLLADFLQEGDPSDPKEIKRRRIVQAATGLFIQLGYRKTNIADVAKRAGVAKGTIYLYFKTKPELLVYAIVEEKKRYMSVVKSVLSPDKAPKDRLREWIRTAFVVGNEMPLTSRVISGDQDILVAVFEYMDAHKERQYAEMQRAFLCAMVDEAAGEGVLPTADVEAKGQVLLGLAYFAGMIANPNIRGHLSIEGFADVLSWLISDGISAPILDDGSQSDKEV